MIDSAVIMVEHAFEIMAIFEDTGTVKDTWEKVKVTIPELSGISNSQFKPYFKMLRLMYPKLLSLHEAEKRMETLKSDLNSQVEKQRVDELEKKLETFEREELRQKQTNKEPVLSEVPQTIQVNGLVWSIQYKSVKKGKYWYYIAYKRIDGKLHQVSLGQRFDKQKVEMRLIDYILKNNL